MRLTVLTSELRWNGRVYKAGDELDADESHGEVRAWFPLGWVKKAEYETKVLTPEPIVEAPATENKPNINPATGKRYYRRRDLKAED